MLCLSLSLKNKQALKKKNVWHLHGDDVVSCNQFRKSKELGFTLGAFYHLTLLTSVIPAKKKKKKKKFPGRLGGSVG